METCEPSQPQRQEALRSLREEEVAESTDHHVPVEASASLQQEVDQQEASKRKFNSPWKRFKIWLRRQRRGETQSNSLWYNLKDWWRRRRQTQVSPEDLLVRPLTEADPATMVIVTDFADIDMLSGVLPIVSTWPKPPTVIVFSDDLDCICKFRATGGMDVQNIKKRFLKCACLWRSSYPDVSCEVQALLEANKIVSHVGMIVQCRRTPVHTLRVIL